MSETLMQRLLWSDQIIIPYEEFKGFKQVSSIVLFAGNSYSSLNSVDDDRSYGPANFVDSGLTSQAILEWTSSDATQKEVFFPKQVTLNKRYFLSGGKYSEQILEMIFEATDGSQYHLRSKGAAYSYGLVLEILRGKL